MKPAQLKRVDILLQLTGTNDLFGYYGLAPDASPDDTTSSIENRRKWAQAQQANPKFKDEARWLIRNHVLIKTLLLQQRKAYLDAVHNRQSNNQVAALTLFAQGAASVGADRRRIDRAVIERAMTLGIDRDQALRCVRRALGEHETTLDTLKDDVETLATAIRALVTSGLFPTHEVDQLLIDGVNAQMTDDQLTSSLRRMLRKREKLKASR